MALLTTNGKKKQTMVVAAQIATPVIQTIGYMAPVELPTLTHIVEKLVEVPVEKIVHVDREVTKEVIKYIDKIVEVPVEKLVHVEKEVIKEVEKLIYKEVPVEVVKETKIIDLSRTFELERQLDSLNKKNKKLKIMLFVSVAALAVALLVR